MKSIRISDQHGVNPSVMQCFYCGEDFGVALLGRLPGDREAPRRAVFDKRPCPKCEGFMRQGIICISVDESKSDDRENPYRSGNWCVVTEDAIRRIVRPESLADDICKRRVTFIPDDAWMAIGLPRAGKTGASEKRKGTYEPMAED